jgi:integrase
MSLVRFNLKNIKSEGFTLIIAVFCYKGNRIRLSTGYSIPPKYWNNKSGRVREVLEFSDGTYINEGLNNISSTIHSIYNKHIISGTLPDKVSLKEIIIKSINHSDSISISKTFWNYFDDFVEFKRKQLGDVRDYHNSLRKHLLQAEILFGASITFNSIKDQQNGLMDVLNNYLTYEAKGADGTKGLSINTIGKQHKNLKVFLNWCFDKNIVDRFSVKHIVTEKEDIETVYVTNEELQLIIKYKPKTKIERIVKDLFIIGCETGLRFSDFTKLSTDHIINNQIHIQPQKTKGQLNNKVIIPISNQVKKIIISHSNKFPKFGKNTLSDFNKTLREIAEEVGIKQKIINHRKVAGKSTSITRRKFELLSSHTCRRTFCTLKFLAGMPVQAIMKFSGHKTERAFMRYLRLDNELVAIKYESFF